METTPEQQLEQESDLRRRIAELEAELRQRVTLEPGERRFRELVDAAHLMVWISGIDAMFTFFNRAWLEFRGRTMEEETGNGWTEGLHPDDRDHCLETYLKAFSARQPFRMQYRVQRANGEYCWIENGES
jgi:PAS domain S-box-containing protein